MPYIGHNPTNAGSFYILDDITLGNSAGPYNLTVAGVSVTPKIDNLLIALDGVLQHAEDAYTISGNQITFDAAPGSGVDFYGVIMGQSASFAQGSIGADELRVDGDGTSLQVLASDGDGTFSWLSQSALTPSANLVTGATLKSTVTASSLTSVGTLTGLTISGDEQALTVKTADSGRVAIALQNSDTGSASNFTDGLLIKLDSDETGHIGMAENKALSLFTNGTTALTISNGQDATFAGNITTVGGMIITQADGSNTDAYFGLGNDADYGQIGANEIGLWNVNNNDIIFGTNNALRMTIANALTTFTTDLKLSDDLYFNGGSDAAWIIGKTNGSGYLRIQNFAELKVDGNIVITNGKGIDFSASSNNSGMTSELLDDYEEGTFQPVMEGSTNQGSFTYIAQVGRYTKIGRMVQIQIYINISACLSVPSGDYMFIRGLPFTNSNDAGVSEGATFSMNYWTLESSVGTPTGFIFRNNASVLLTHSNANGGASVGILTPSDWATSATSMGRNIYGSATYYVD